jgi:hypothetical protein
MLMLPAALRRLRSMMMARTMMLTIIQPPIVPPIIAPRLGSEGPDTGVSIGASEGVARTVTVAVRYSSFGIELVSCPGDLIAVLVKAAFAQPCWVMMVLL